MEKFKYAYFPDFTKESGVSSFKKVSDTAICVDKCPGKEATPFKCGVPSQCP